MMVRATTCCLAVSADVNPEPTVVTVPPKETREVVTYLSSLARVFVPTVVCRAN
jgi:hypothetical protein